MHHWIIGSTLCLIYYFFGCWVVEEQYIDKFRSFNKWISRIEFGLRCVILMAFALFTVMLQQLIPPPGASKPTPGMSGVRALLLFLTLVLALALIWDFVIWLGEKTFPASSVTKPSHACGCASPSPANCPMVVLHQQTQPQDNQPSVARKFFLIDMVGIVPVVALVWAIYNHSEFWQAWASYLFTIFAVYAAQATRTMLHPGLTSRFRRNRLR